MPRLLPTSARPARRRAFTLIEIMVVVAVIVILAGLTVAIGAQVKANGQRSNTQATLTTLRECMKDYLDKGNPEPLMDKPVDETALPAASYPVTTPPSDTYNWVKLLFAYPETAAKLNGLKTATDATGNRVVLDGYGTPIRYVLPVPKPGDPTKLQSEGYFVSAGPDRVFSAQTAPALNPTPPLDDIRSNGTF